MITKQQHDQLVGYLESSEVLSITFPFAFGTSNDPCLLIVSEAGGGRFTDVIAPDGTTRVIDQLSAPSLTQRGER